nr:ribosomal protein S7 [Nitzschia traheaformis]
MRKFLRSKKLFLKNKITNIFMKSGKKKTVEKILLKFVKTSQKSNNKKFETLFHSAIINTTPVFSVNTQVLKKGKRKSTKDVPSFLSNDSVRIKNSINFFKESVVKEKKNERMHKMLVKEVLNSSSTNSTSINKKSDVQNKVLLNRRYWSNFKW